MVKLVIASILGLCALWGYAECAMTMEQMMNAAKGFRSVCQPKLGVDTAVLDGMRKGQFPEDPKFKCYLKCVMNKIRTLRDGKLDMDMMLKQIELMMPVEVQDRVKTAAKTCDALTSGKNLDDECDTAYHFIKCNWDTDSEVFFFP